MLSRLVSLSVAISLLFAGCTCGEPPVAIPKQFSIGGTVEGYAGSGLILEATGGAQVAVEADGAFTFPNRLDEGTEVTVSVATQPVAAWQTCTVNGGDFTLTGDVTDLSVICETNRFQVGGTVTGLQGNGLTLQINDGDALSIAGDGTFLFPVEIESGHTFTVSIGSQPALPTQTCMVVGGSGTMAGGPVTSVVVNCATDRFVVGGTLSGLEGSGLVLQNRGGDDVPVTANGTFAFPTASASGEGFEVTVLTHPTAPAQTCVVSSGSGAVVASNVLTVQVSCTTNTHAIGGTVAGLLGGGLVLQNNEGDEVSVSADGTFTFPVPVASGRPYSVTVLGQPTGPWQTCTVAAGSGIVVDSPIANVAVTCATDVFAVGGTVTGLAGTGLVLRNKGGDDLTVAADGTFAFAVGVASGAAFDVSIAVQPSAPWQTCSVIGGQGTVQGGAISSVVVNCATNQHVVGGTIAGLAGAGLELSLNGNPAVSVNASGSFGFPTALDSGAAYAVTIVRQPTAPWQTCSLANGTGTIADANIENVEITCVTREYLVGGTVSGLRGSGSALVLRNNGGDDLHVGADGSFQFPSRVQSGGGYAVTIASQPTSPWQTCVVSEGAGVITDNDIRQVAITCTTNRYAIGGSISGLTGGTVVLQNVGGDDLTISSNGAFTFATTIESGSAYEVTVRTQPTAPWQTCAVEAGSGSVAGNAVADVAITCVTHSYAIKGSVVGLQGLGLELQNNGGEALVISADGAFTFPMPVLSGATFQVTIRSQPTSPWQTCAVSGGTGVVGGADVESVTVNCVTNSYVIGGTVGGLAGRGLVLHQDGQLLPISGDGAFAFPMPVRSGAAYAVTVVAQPSSPWQTCTVAAGTGTVAASDVNLSVTCVTNRYPVSVSTGGLLGSGLVVQLNGGSNLAIDSDGVATFSTPVSSGSIAAVSVLTQPTSPWQTCVAATGTMGGAPLTLAMDCTTNTYALGGSVTGLDGSLVLQNGADVLTIGTSGTFTFAGSFPSGASYSVEVASQPAGQFCTVGGASGVMGGAAVSSVTVSCVHVGSCAELLNLAPDTASGLHSLDFDKAGPTPPELAWCDMTEGGGGWTNLDFSSSNVRLRNGISVQCTRGLTHTSNAITCDGPYFNGDTNLPLYHGRCDGQDRSGDYIRDHMGPLLGHRGTTELGFAALSQSDHLWVGTNATEYCYINGELVQWDDARCSAYNVGNADCFPTIFTLIR